MREIKFRAWHKKDKEMSEFSFTNNLITIDDKDDLHICSNNGGWDFFDKDLVLMQYTGLKDKNGKEIYEGDIINLGEEGHAIPEVIIFANGSFGIVASWIKNKDLNYNFIELNKYCNDVFFRTVELIGNIYENPDLLTQNK